jgi:metal-responsive CopG/Arc/MetJ family transcriptional regulator
MAMARREVRVELDDDLVARLDRLAAARGTSRSELLRSGAVAVLDAEDERQADRELQAAYRRIPQDPAVVDMAAKLAAETIPDW